MSDESAPPEPRLKLKLRPEGTPAPSAPSEAAKSPPEAVPAAPAPPQKEAPAASEKIRLKTRVSIAPSEATAAEPGAPASPPTPPREPAPAAAGPIPPPPSPPPAEVADGAARSRLKPKAPPGAAPADAIPGDAAVIFKAVTAPPAAPPPSAPAPTPRVPAVEEEAPPRRSNLTKVLGAVAFVLVLLFGAHFVYQRFLTPAAPPPPPPKSASAQTKPATTALGQAVQKANATVAAVESGRAKAAEEVMPSEPTPAPAVRPATAPTAAIPPSTPAVKPAPSLPPAPPAGPPPPSPQFRQFVDNLKVSGFRVGPPGRLFVGGVLYLQGAVLNKDLGVVFVGVDPQTEDLIFKDATGAVMKRRL